MMKMFKTITLLTAVVCIMLLGVVPASAVGNTPSYRGDPNSVHAIFEWDEPQSDWEVTHFETSESFYSFAAIVPSASDDGEDITIILPNFIDPLPLKLMRIQLFFDGEVDGDLIDGLITAFDPEDTLVEFVGGSAPGLSDFHYLDIEIRPNPDWEEIIIFGNTGANVIPGNLLTIEIDTVSLPEPATLIVLALGLLPVMIGKSRKFKKQL